MKFQQSALNFLLPIIAAGTAAANSYDGCIILDRDGKCLICYHRKAIQSGDGCGAKRAANDHCATYYDKTINQAKCDACDPGYALKNIPESVPICVKATIKGCHVEYISTGNFGDYDFCEACSNGKYSVASKSTRYTYSCQAVSNPILECQYGGPVEQGTPSCYKCNPGYSLSFEIPGCSPSNFEGCWIEHGNSCFACDPEQGYSINQDGLCYKTN